MAMKADGFVGRPNGFDAAVAELTASGLRGTGFRVLRDFEGLSGDLHAYKIDIAKSMLEMGAALGCDVLLACSSTSTHYRCPRRCASRANRVEAIGIPRFWLADSVLRLVAQNLSIFAR